MRLTVARVVAALLVVGALCGGGLAPSGIAAPDRFVALSDGVTLDRKTKLQWTSHDHDRALAWDPADRHCKELMLGERSGWRLPKVTDLQAVYDKNATQTCGERICHLDAAIQLRGPYVWSGTGPSEGTRFYFDFATGNRLSPGIPPTLVRRVLCVRDRAASSARQEVKDVRRDPLPRP